MKRNAIARIIIYSIIILALLGLLAVGVGVSVFTVDIGSGGDSYITGSSPVSAEEIHNLQIEWAAGNIRIETADTDTISFQEHGSSGDQPMVHYIKGDTLVIAYAQQQTFFGFSSTASKDLTVTVPTDWVCNALSVDAASADLNLAALTANEVDVDFASGNCYFEECHIDKLDLDGASGIVSYSGSLNTLECDTVSGNVSAKLENTPRSISFDGVSADLELTLPGDAGFQVSTETLSGDFSSDFDTSYQNGRHIYGNGFCQIDAEGVSGSIIIRKPQ